MGYRSDVALCLSKEGIKQFKEGKKKLGEDEKKALGELMAGADRHLFEPSTGSELWVWNQRKWYDDFEDVRAFQKVMDEVDFDEYRTVKIGEDMNDNEEMGAYWGAFQLGVERTVGYVEVADMIEADKYEGTACIDSTTPGTRPGD